MVRNCGFLRFYLQPANEDGVIIIIAHIVRTVNTLQNVEFIKF